MRSRLAALFVITALFLVCARVRAADCDERCFQSFMACARFRAPGCDVAGRPVGTPAVRLAKATGHDEALSALESTAQISSDSECEALLIPCNEIELSCHINCVPTDEPASAAIAEVHEDVEMDFTESQEQPAEPQATAPKIPQGVKSGTLRIFSSHPQVRVFLNEWEVPVKPENGDVESLITPKLAVGNYWARLTSPDGQWRWEGEAFVSSAKVNEINAELIDLAEVREDQENALKKYSKKIWREIKKLENADKYNAAISAYESFVEVYPKKKALCRRATRKMDKLKKRYEEVLFDEILDTVEIDPLQRLCSLYLADYKEGENTDSVRKIAGEIRQVRIQLYKNAKMKNWFTTGCGESPTGGGGSMCYLPGGSFTMGYDE